jgi:type 2 lantibiotic biosynthesis protein LanM
VLRCEEFASVGPQSEGVLALFAPIIHRGCDLLHKGVQAIVDRIPFAPFDPASARRLFLPALAERLFKLASGTFALELNVARLGGLLRGGTPEERFQSYLQLLLQPETALALLEEYPVLARLAAETVNYWTEFALEFLVRLSTDWPDLRDTFEPGQDPGPLICADVGAGDSHRAGRCVVVAHFSSGFRLVYKPRSLAVDRHFQELQSWLNDRGRQPPFRLLKVLDRRSHGWVEFIEAGGCASTAELRRFYRRQGGHLAVLYALEAVDFHSENLVAAGEYPVLIDLEGLFHPRVAGSQRPGSNALQDDLPEWSVLGIGMLPFFVGEAENRRGIDLSGLGCPPGQITPFDLPQWEDSGTDTMRLTQKPLALPARQNRPTLGGSDIDPAGYADEIVEGFEQVYRLLFTERSSLLSADGPLAPFANDEVRFIARDTQSYAALLQASYHPDALRDALDRDRVLDLLWVQAESRPWLATLITSEHRDLWKGDIPHFTSRPGSRDLWNSSNEGLAGFFAEPGMIRVRRRFERLSENDLAQQTRLLRQALSAAKEGGN